ncbi:hypothetical protein ACF06W_22465 [Streptomyces albus]|uniref:hypothetical protein n=1 Tax=Streptomyces albus TaxID=1888 RepID=UPI0036FF322F
MANLSVNTALTQEDAHELAAAGDKMYEALQQLVQELQSLSQSFLGNSKEAWQAIQTENTTKDEDALNALKSASITLSSMVQSHADADWRGALGIQGQ